MIFSHSRCLLSPTGVRLKLSRYLLMIFCSSRASCRSSQKPLRIRAISHLIISFLENNTPSESLCWATQRLKSTASFRNKRFPRFLSLTEPLASIYMFSLTISINLTFLLTRRSYLILWIINESSGWTKSVARVGKNLNSIQERFKAALASSVSLRALQLPA